MQPPQNSVRGLFKIDGLPDLACKEINSFADAIKALPDFAVVELPASFNSTIVGAQAPTADDTNKIWYRFDLNSNFIGIYAFQAGAWELVVQPAPSGFYRVERFGGDSANPPNGWSLVTAGYPTYLSVAARNALVADDIPAGAGPYSLAWYVFSGYT